MYYIHVWHTHILYGKTYTMRLTMRLILYILWDLYYIYYKTYTIYYTARLILWDV